MELVLKSWHLILRTTQALFFKVLKILDAKGILHVVITAMPEQ